MEDSDNKTQQQPQPYPGMPMMQMQPMMYQPMTMQVPVMQVPLYPAQSDVSIRGLVAPRPQPQNTAPKSAIISLPTKKMIGIFPLIVAFCVIALELLLALLNIVIALAKDSATEIARIQKTGFILSDGVLTFHNTWGIVFSLTLSFVTSSISVALGRRGLSVFGTLNGFISTIFLLDCIWVWMFQGNVGIQLIIKYVIRSITTSVPSAAVIRNQYYEPYKIYFNLILSWGLPIQCIVVLVDGVLSLCRKRKPRQVPIKLQSQWNDKLQQEVILTKVDIKAIDLMDNGKK